MTATPRTDPRQQGAITILVVLMLLVLLTIASLAMSKNAIRSAIASGTLRQVHQAENASDTGLEWAVYWMNNAATTGAGTGGALALQNQMVAMQQAGNFGMPATTLVSPDFTLSTASNVTLSYDVTLDLMGQTVPFYQGQGPGGTSTTAPQVSALNLWTVTSNGYVTYPNGVTFTHRRQVWVTTPQS